jgi:hypothetical protein
MAEVGFLADFQIIEIDHDVLIAGLGDRGKSQIATDA